MISSSYVVVPIGLCCKKIEIMHFVQGKLCVKSIELYAKLCANSIIENSHVFFILRSFCRLFSLKR